MKCKFCNGEGYVNVSVATSNGFVGEARKCTAANCNNPSGYNRYVQEKYATKKPVKMDSKVLAFPM